MARSVRARSHRLLLNKYYVDEIYDAADRAADPGRVAGRAVARLRRAA